MRKAFYIVLVISFFSCGRKENPTFVVEGTIKNANAKTMYLEEDVAGNHQPVVVDSALISKDGSFKVSGPGKEETLFSLRTDQSMFPFALLINDSKKVAVTADLANKAQPYTVMGSSASQGIIEFDKNMDAQAKVISSLARKVDSLSKAKVPDSITNIPFGQYSAALQEQRDYTIDFLNKSSSPVLTLYALGSYQHMADNLGTKGFTEPEIAELVTKASVRFPNNTTLNDIKNRLKPRKAPDFAMPDTTGHPISLSSFKGKYVLVDFWASWCGPCREENPNVVNVYNQFKAKNFTILGVSLDKTRDAWIKAIKDDGLAWNHVSDLKYWNNAAAVLYNVNGIPYNFLIDPDGNIIAENIRGQELFATLNKVLK